MSQHHPEGRPFDGVLFICGGCGDDHDFDKGVTADLLRCLTHCEPSELAGFHTVGFSTVETGEPADRPADSVHEPVCDVACCDRHVPQKGQVCEPCADMSLNHTDSTCGTCGFSVLCEVCGVGDYSALIGGPGSALMVCDGCLPGCLETPPALRDGYTPPQNACTDCRKEGGL